MTLFCLHQIAGALAEKGCTLEEVKIAAEKVAASMGKTVRATMAAKSCR